MGSTVEAIYWYYTSLLTDICASHSAGSPQCPPSTMSIDAATFYDGVPSEVVCSTAACIEPITSAQDTALVGEGNHYN